jgi:AraC family transcriptional regulator of adaptative response / DNA-3-methyladenine glycosylase II
VEPREHARAAFVASTSENGETGARPRRTSSRVDAMLDPDACYRALVARDARFDGVFFVGVTTTGIYCRPVCRARTPGRQ